MSWLSSIADFFGLRKPRPDVKKRRLAPAPFESPPAAIAAALQAAGLDPARTTRWFESAGKPVYRSSVPGKDAVHVWELLRAR